jgi:hypothetical protein
MMWRSTLYLALILLAGCVWPHTTLRSGDVTGRVLDSSTHMPIKGATVRFVTPPFHTVLTDGQGYFHFKVVHQFHYGYLPPEGEWPDRKDHIMAVSHPAYKTRNFGAGYDGNALGDFLLAPTP